MARQWRIEYPSLIYGSQSFVAEIKGRYLDDTRKAELPQYNSMFREFDPDVLLDKGSAILGFDIVSAQNIKKVSPIEIDHRDLLIYLLWQEGRLSNNDIGKYFGLTYSAVIFSKGNVPAPV